MTEALLDHPLETIYKYSLRPLGQVTELKLPANAVPVLVGEQGGVACVWMRHPRLPATDVRTFRVAATGGTLLPHEQHIGSFQSGDYVWHVVEVLSAEKDTP